jgi:thioredoxin reductase
LVCHSWNFLSGSTGLVKNQIADYWGKIVNVKISMMKTNDFDVIIIGGSYSGLAAAMALGRALRNVLVIDSGTPSNKQTPRSHNFITNDGKTPSEIHALAKEQVERYKTVKFYDGLVTNGKKFEGGFEIGLATGEKFNAVKLIFATGIRDLMPAIEGFAQCWGISVLHCPYCHGFEVRHAKTGILGNGEYGFEFSRLISNWTNDITLYTNGLSTLTKDQEMQLGRHNIQIIEKPVEKLEHSNGYVENIIFTDGTRSHAKAIYASVPFEQQCPVLEELGCEIKDGYITIDGNHKTTVDGVFACGDNVTRLRTVANAVGMGTTTGIMVNKEIIIEKF